MTVVVASLNTINRDDIIRAALRLVNKEGGLGETPSADQTDDCAQKLNMIVALLSGQKDGGQGIKMWSRKRAYVFLQKDTSVYSLGPNGDEATPAFSRTTISADEAEGQTILSITSGAGMSADDQIGILLDSGIIQWTTIAATGASTVTVGDTLDGAVSAGNVVYWYTNGISQPQEILHAALITSSGSETPLGKLDLSQYSAVPNKTADGDPCSYYYELQADTGDLYLDFQPSDLTKTLKITYLAPIEEFDSAEDTPDFPKFWNLPLVNMLAYAIWPEYRSGERPQWLITDRNESLTIAQRAIPENDSSFFQSAT
jgi:hypothetical protein